MPVPANLVHQESVTTGTGDLTLTAVNGKQSFATAFTTGGTSVFDYFISNRNAAEWERGTGSCPTATSLKRDECIETSAGSTVRISFTAGTLDVVNDVPARLQVRTLSTVASTGLFAVFDSTQGNLIKVAETAPLTSITSGEGITVSGSTVSAELATTNNTGITELAEAAEYRANTAGNLSLNPAAVWTAAGAVALSTATTAVAVDMSTFLTVATLSISTPMTLSNPTNAKVGQHFIVAAQVSGSTAQTVSLGTNYKRWTGVEAPPYSIAASGAEKLYVCGFVETSTGIIVTSVGRTTAVT